jgi:Flp pilus assembly protein TadG
MVSAIRRHLFRYRRSQSGATAVEFALVLPAFVTLVFGIFELSRLIFVGASVQWAVDRAARLAIINPDVSASEIEQEIDSYLEMAGNPPVVVTLSTSTIDTLEIIEVAATYEHTVEAPFIPPFSIDFDFQTMIPKP